MMNLPPKIKSWIQADYCPQRCLISGGSNTFDTALEVAAHFLKVPTEKLKLGTEADLLLLKDTGESFKIGDDQNPDLESARGLIKWVSQKPIKSRRIVVLENFERASREAPQTLLKILEEPPAQALFLFTTKNHHQILPTILSRMTVITNPDNQDLIEASTEVQSFLSPGNLHLKMKQIDQIDQLVKKSESREPLLNFIKELLHHCRKNSGHQKYLESVFGVQEKVNRNMNHRLLLEQLALRASIR